MAQHISDPTEAHPLPQEVNRQRMTQCMGPDLWDVQSAATNAALKDVIYRRRLQRSVRCLLSKEEFAYWT